MALDRLSTALEKSSSSKRSLVICQLKKFCLAAPRGSIHHIERKDMSAVKSSTVLTDLPEYVEFYIASPTT
jgi:hypothetical protein